MSDTRVVEVVREATPGELCVGELEIAEGDFIPCNWPASLVFRIHEAGTFEDALLCDGCGTELKQEIIAQPGGDAILP